MKDLPPQYQALAESRNLAADDILLAGLCHLERPYDGWAVDVLVARGQVAALERLVGQYHELPEACRNRMAAHCQALEGALRAAMASPAEATRLNAIELAARGESPSLSYLLIEGLNSSQPAVRRRAATGLREMAAKFCVLPQSCSAPPSQSCEGPPDYSAVRDWRDQRAQLAESLRQGLRCFDVHRRPAVLEAAALFSLELEEDFRAEARKLGSRCWRTICDMIASDPRPDLATATLQALALEEVRSSIVHVLSRCQEHSFMVAVMERSWMVCDPTIAAGCRSLKQLAWLQHRPHALLEMPLLQLRQTMRFLRVSGIARPVLLGWIRLVVECGKLDQQLVGLREMIRMDGEASTELLRMLSEWAEPEIAEVARRELYRRDPDDFHLRQLRRRQNHLSHQRLVPPDHCDFEWLEQRYDALDDAQRQLAGRGLLSKGFDVEGRLGTMLKSEDPGGRARAMDMMRVMGVEGRMKEHILAAAQDPDRVVRSAAVRALARLPDQASHRALIRALEDPDRRVRANAIDALDELRARDCVDKIIPCLSDDDHRVRAAAVRALLKLHVRQAAQTLLELLRNPSKAHRLSGLWVVERYGLAGALNQIAALAQNDPDETVRRRAQRLLRAQQQPGGSHPAGGRQPHDPGIC